MTDTIFALASGRGRAGVAVLRVSGDHAFDSYKALANIDIIQYRQARLSTIRDNVSRETLDKAVTIAFQSPASYTGEDTVEYHLHGGAAIINGVLRALAQQPHHRMAEAGEFTRRAFENGKMDLTEAEAVADLIDAETALQKQQAFRQMGGALAVLYDGWREDLKKILAYVEAELEFPDEDLPVDVLAEITPRVHDLRTTMAAHLNDNRRGERLRNGVKIAVIGAPNAGKSSFVNALAQRNVAIVSDIAGTTRDVIEAHLDLGGYPVIISDTAGLRPDQIGTMGHDAIEAEGIRRALYVAEDADIRIILYDGAQATPDEHSLALESGGNTLVFINKADQDVVLQHPANPLRISVKTEYHVAEALARITAMLHDVVGQSDAPTLTRQRHRDALTSCVESLDRALSAPLPELTAEDLRLAIRHLGSITGRVDIEELLDVVFRDFCIGK